ncbi:hypothetical protein GCM10010207_18410 [Streptomyces atratus]|nr:hypothetical protein GCM10010207_18410 [Streptomyces atratus]
MNSQEEAGAGGTGVSARYVEGLPAVVPRGASGIRRPTTRLLARRRPGRLLDLKAEVLAPYADVLS